MLNLLPCPPDHLKVSRSIRGTGYVNAQFVVQPVMVYGSAENPAVINTLTVATRFLTECPLDRELMYAEPASLQLADSLACH